MAALAVAPGIFLIKLGNARPADRAVGSKVRWGMLIDTAKCATAAMPARAPATRRTVCIAWGDPETDAQWIRKVRLRDKQTGFVQSLPLMCQHCEHPPCVDVCPTGASFKRADGIVLVDQHICIGCRYCMMACPYKARSFVHEDARGQVPQVPRGKGCVESCTFCVQRVDVGRTPACVEACNEEHHGAMVFGDLNDPESEVARKLKSVSSRELRQDLGLNTGVRYQGI